MKCVRCGYCCCAYMVVVVHPKVVVRNLKFDRLTEEDCLFLDGSAPCPNLSWEEDKAVCGIHHYKWYKKTPCFSHGQIEQSADDLCRMGEYIRKHYSPVKNHVLKQEYLKGGKDGRGKGSC